MNKKQFWSIIARLDWSKRGDDSAVCRPAVVFLASLSDAEIFGFEEVLRELLYSIDTEAHARAIGHGAFDGSRDGFDAEWFLYARCCVVASGEEVYSAVVDDPTCMPKDLEFEALLYVACAAYKMRNGKDMNYGGGVSVQTYANTGGWEMSSKRFVLMACDVSWEVGLISRAVAKRVNAYSSWFAFALCNRLEEVRIAAPFRALRVSGVASLECVGLQLGETALESGGVIMDLRVDVKRVVEWDGSAGLLCDMVGVACVEVFRRTGWNPDALLALVEVLRDRHPIVRQSLASVKVARGMIAFMVIGDVGYSRLEMCLMNGEDSIIESVVLRRKLATAARDRIEFPVARMVLDGRHVVGYARSGALLGRFRAPESWII